MKAAVIYQKGDMPVCTDVPAPVVQHSHELLLTVRAAAMKHFDKSVARGTHYSTIAGAQPRIIGGDGAGTLPDGTRVYALGVSGMAAEKALIDGRRMVILPDQLDFATAAALPNAVAGSAMALRFRAGMQPGDTVLINGATGFTGRLAVQIARHYGAKKIIATGRNPDSLKQLLKLGADEVISLSGSDTEFVQQVQHIHEQTPIDVIVDYLWGHTAELLLAALKGNGAFTHRTRFVSVGSMTGDKIQLSAENLRSVNLQLTGSGLGSWTAQEMDLLFSQILPELLQLAAAGHLHTGITQVPLGDIAGLWDMEIPAGNRLVIVM